MTTDTDTQGVALEPCPFCGSAPKLRRIVEEYAADADGPAGEYDAWFKIQCDNCGAEQSEEYRSDAIAAWNRRAYLSAADLIADLRAKVERLERENETYRTAFDGIEPAAQEGREAVALIPRAENCGRYLAEVNDGRLLYLNHANTWQECPNFIIHPAPAQPAAQVVKEELGRFGYHPDPAIDFEIEVEALENEWLNTKAGFMNGTPTRSEIEARVERAMQFRVGGDEGAVSAKNRLRKLEEDIRAASPTDADAAVSGGVTAIAAERRRQVEQEGWTPEHDDEHEVGEMASAAACYASLSAHYPYHATRLAPRAWPWADEWWKPSDPRRDLVKAGALIAAEIDRLDRLTAAKAGEDGRHG